MRKLIIAALLLISIGAYAQPSFYKADKLYANQSLYLKNVRIDSISNDTSFAAQSPLTFATQYAIYKFVNRSIANNTVSSIAWANITGKPTASGTTSGILTSADWNGFNGKQDALNGSGLVFMNGTSVSYKSSLDSLTVPALHSWNFYNTKYLPITTTLSSLGGIDSIRQDADVLYNTATFTKSNTTGVSNSTLKSQTANTVFAAPSGTSGTPTFRNIDTLMFGNQFANLVNNAARNASATQSGFVSTGSQTFAGTKTFTGTVNLNTGYGGITIDYGANMRLFCGQRIDYQTNSTSIQHCFTNQLGNVLNGSGAAVMQIEYTTSSSGVVAANTGTAVLRLKGNNALDALTVFTNGNANLYGELRLNTTTSTGDIINANGTIRSTQYKLSNLNTAPASSTDTGTLGEIRITSTYIYVCTATNTWVRSALSTF